MFKRPEEWTLSGMWGKEPDLERGQKWPHRKWQDQGLAVSSNSMERNISRRRA